MNYLVETAAPELEADAFVRGEERRGLSLAGFRGTWAVVAVGASHDEILELAALEEAFAANGAVVLATSAADWHSVASAYADTRVRFPILAGVDEGRVTLVVDPDGYVRYAGRTQTARELLATLESVLYVSLDQRRAA